MNRDPKEMFPRGTGAVAILACVSAFLGASYIYIKHHFTYFHTRDYSYYVTKYLCIARDNCDSFMTLNPNGRNMLGWKGVDGFPYIYNDIHFSFLTWLFKIANGFFGSVVFIYSCWIVAGVIVALLTFKLLILQLDLKRSFKITIVFILLPSFGLLISSDLRIFIYLCVGILVLTYGLLRRSDIILWAGAVGLFLVREESILFIAIAALWLGLFGERKQALGLTFFSIANLIIAQWYFLQQPHDFSPAIKEVIFYLVCILLWVLSMKPALIPQTMMVNLIKYSDILIPLSFAVPFGAEIKNFAEDWLLLSPRSYVVFVLAVIGLLAAVQRVGVAAKLPSFGVAAKLPSWGVILACAVLLVINASLLTSYVRNGYPLARPIAGALVSQGAKVLTDYELHQAFNGYSKAFVFYRLPGVLFADQEANRFFPENETVLEDLLRNWANVIMVTEEGAADLARHFGSVSILHGEKIRCNGILLIHRADNTVSQQAIKNIESRFDCRLGNSISLEHRTITSPERLSHCEHRRGGRQCAYPYL